MAVFLCRGELVYLEVPLQGKFFCTHLRVSIYSSTLKDTWTHVKAG